MEILGLEDRVTMQQVKTRHRDLVKRFHPDCGEVNSDQRQIQKINTAYQVLLEYLASYRFSFSEDEFYFQNPEENLRRQFMDDPLWGGKSEP